jgi:hypothetical protein
MIKAENLRALRGIMLFSFCGMMFGLMSYYKLPHFEHFPILGMGFFGFIAAQLLFIVKSEEGQDKDVAILRHVVLILAYVIAFAIWGVAGIMLWTYSVM